MVDSAMPEERYLVAEAGKDQCRLVKGQRDGLAERLHALRTPLGRP